MKTMFVLVMVFLLSASAGAVVAAVVLFDHLRGVVQITVRLPGW